jgi:hypothetical protein
MSTKFQILFGLKQSTPLVMPHIGYIVKFFNKAPYELLNGMKPSIYYVRVFGCKCYILRKGSRLSKFQSKCDEGFLVGYSSNSKAYRVYNKSMGFVEEAYDVQFDETMGSQDEKENLDDVRGEELSKAMKTMSMGISCLEKKMMMKIHQYLFKQIHVLPQQMIKINKRVTQATMTHLKNMIKWPL